MVGVVGGGWWRWWVVERLGLGLEFGGEEVSGGGWVGEEIEVLEGDEGLHQSFRGRREKCWA